MTTMTQDQLCDLVLTRLYQKRFERGLPDLMKVLEADGITEYPPVYYAAEVLNRRGLLDPYFVADVTVVASIGSEGVRLVERLGVGNSVMDYFHRLEGPSEQVHFHGGISGSNVAVHSPNAKQSVTVRSEAHGLAEVLLAAIERDRTLPAEAKAEALADAESLKSELVKDKPNPKIVRVLLSALSTVASAAEHVGKIVAVFKG